MDSLELSGNRSYVMVCPMEESDIDIIMGQNLRRLRLARGLSQEDLALLLGAKVTKQRVSAIENGREGMGKNLISKACHALNAELWEFSWTEKTPIIKDAQELEDVKLRREAVRVGIDGMVREAEASWIGAAKKNTGLVGEGKAGGLPRSRNKQRAG